MFSWLFRCVTIITVVVGVSVSVPVASCHAVMNVVLHLGASVLFKDSSPGVLDRCSVGLKAKDRYGRDGFITAGHCAHEAGQKAFIKYEGHKVAVGRMMRYVPYHSGVSPDFGFVVVRNDDAVSVSVDRLIPSVGEVTGVYRGAIPYGSIVCKRGSTSGITCGRVVASGMRFAYFGNRSGSSSGGGAMSLPGDSGGVVFYKDVSTGGIIVVGIVTDRLVQYFHGIPPGFGVVQMIDDIEKVLGVTVV